MSTRHSRVAAKPDAEYVPPVIPDLAQILSDAMLLTFEHAGLPNPIPDTRAFAEQMLANSPALRCFQEDIALMNNSMRKFQVVGL